MDVFEAVRTVLAVREYRPDPIPAEVVGRIVEAGRLTASSMNKQPWHFVVVDDRAALQRLGELAKTGPYIAQAPLAVVVAGLVTAAIAVQGADDVLDADARAQSANAPALKARNHAATPGETSR